MKIRILLDVFQNSQNANPYVVQAGEYIATWISPPLSNQKRYEVEVEVSHPSDAEKIEGIIKEQP